MVFWGQIRVDKTKLDQIITLPNFTLMTSYGLDDCSHALILRTF